MEGFGPVHPWFYSLRAAPGLWKRTPRNWFPRPRSNAPTRPYPAEGDPDQAYPFQDLGVDPALPWSSVTLTGEVAGRGERGLVIAIIADAWRCLDIHASSWTDWTPSMERYWDAFDWIGSEGPAFSWEYCLAALNIDDPSYWRECFLAHAALASCYEEGLTNPGKRQERYRRIKRAWAATKGALNISRQGQEDKKRTQCEADNAEALAYHTAYMAERREQQKQAERAALIRVRRQNEIDRQNAMAAVGIRLGGVS